MLNWIFAVLGIAFSGLVWWCSYLADELDEQKATVAVMKQDAIALKASLGDMAAWTAVTDKILEEHRLTVKKQAAEFRKLQTQVRAAYDDKDTSEWGRDRVPDSLRILLGGKPSAAGH